MTLRRESASSVSEATEVCSHTWIDKENTITEILETLAALSVLVFVIGSMASMGLSLKIKQIIEPLKDVKLGILAGVLFILASLVVGFLLGGSDSGIRNVMGLGTAQRNISAALVVAAQNFSPDVITYLMVIAVIGLVVLMPAAGELGKRAKAAQALGEPDEYLAPT